MEGEVNTGGPSRAVPSHPPPTPTATCAMRATARAFALIPSSSAAPTAATQRRVAPVGSRRCSARSRWVQAASAGTPGRIAAGLTPLLSPRCPRTGSSEGEIMGAGICTLGIGNIEDEGRMHSDLSLCPYASHLSLACACFCLFLCPTLILSI